MVKVKNTVKAKVPVKAKAKVPVKAKVKVPVKAKVKVPEKVKAPVKDPCSRFSWAFPCKSNSHYNWRSKSSHNLLPIS
jgi:hypothetical protein